MDISIQNMAQNARKASLELASATFEKRNEVLLAIAKQIEVHQEEILSANHLDSTEIIAEHISFIHPK